MINKHRHSSKSDTPALAESPMLAFVADSHRYYKSSESGMGGCVAVAWLPDGSVLVADDKDPSLAPHTYNAAEWKTFVEAVKNGQFDRPPA